MLDKCLAMWVGEFEWLVIMLIVIVLPIVVVVFIVKSIIRSKRENQRLRLEVGKLADEIQQIRKQMGGRQPEDSD